MLLNECEIPDGNEMIKMGALPVDWELLEAQICVF